MFTTGVLIGLGLILLLAFMKSYVRVDEGHLAVLTTFGAAELKDEKAGSLLTLKPGIHFKKPWQKVVTVKMMEQNVELSGEDSGRVAMANDGTVLRFDSVLRYQPLESGLATFLFGMRAPIEHITGLFTCLLRNEIANFRVPWKEGDKPAKAMMALATSNADFVSQGGSYAIIRRERQRLNKQIEEFTHERIGAHYGIQFNAVDLVDILPPDELADALNGVINTQAESEAAYFHAESDCQQRLLSAERGVDIARARAKAAAVEIVRVGSFLAELHKTGMLEEYVARRRSEVMNDSRTVLVKERVS